MYEKIAVQIYGPNLILGVEQLTPYALWSSGFFLSSIRYLGLTGISLPGLGYYVFLSRVRSKQCPRIVPTRAFMGIRPYIRILGIVWLEICVKNSKKNDLSYEINYVIIDGLFIKLSSEM